MSEINVSTKELMELFVERFYNKHHNFEQFKKDIVTFGELQRAVGVLFALKNMSEDRHFAATISSVQAQVQDLHRILTEGK